MKFNYEQSTWGQGTATSKWTDPTSFRLKQALLSLRDLPSSAKILEVGCGVGQFIRAIKNLRADLECHGCDISQSAIESAKLKNDKVVYTLSNAFYLPDVDNNFDAVLIFDVLEHVEDVAIILSEVKRVLKTDGIFYCFVPCEGDYLSLWNMLRRKNKYANLTKKYAGHVNYFSRHQLNQLLEDSGFEIMRVRYSEHILGQLLGFFTFLMMDNLARKNGSSQMNNEQFFSSVNQNQSVIFKLFKNTVNFLVNLESYLLSWLPSPNIHLFLKQIQK
jgi:ubiquinone/menaquinone biosynthesis C-methylase UbiE